VEEKETYPDCGEKDADGAKNGGGWCDARELLCEIEAVDGHIQRGENTVPPFWSLGIVCHSRNARQLQESGAAWRLRERIRALAEVSGHFVIARLVGLGLATVAFRGAAIG